MKDQLEDFVRQNKERFDDQEPSEKVWKTISNRLFNTHSLWNSLSLWRAAAVVLLGLCVYLWIPKLSENREKDIALTELKDIETFYFSQIAEKVDQIEDYKGQEGMNGFTSDFQQLEAMYHVLKEEMKTRPSQKVKDALVLNLLIRIDLLNQQLHKIDKEEKIEKEEMNSVNA
jgi:hypothetical protein